MMKQIISLLLSIFYFYLIPIVLSRYRKLFFLRYGRRHRVLGFFYLVILISGVIDIGLRSQDYLPILDYVVYDFILGVGGILLTVSAASDFNAHDHIQNPKGVVSGTLSDSATVSTSEMWEHSFYQMLNLCQSIYLHVLSATSFSCSTNCFLLELVTLPWMLRKKFPINSFSANYDKDRQGDNPYTIVNLIYRIKKYQYLFYKHFLLHGLNILQVLKSSLNPTSFFWRSYWLCLNSSYVMEFFLQTLVKRGHMQQKTMLILNNLLMLCSTLAAMVVLKQNIATSLAVSICLLSWLLNILRRGNEVVNVALVTAVFLFFSIVYEYEH